MNPLRAIPLPVHFVVIGPDQVKVKLAGSDKWVMHCIRREEGILWWTIVGKDVPWAFVSLDDVPQWAHDVFARGRAKLEKDDPEQDAALKRQE